MRCADDVIPAGSVASSASSSRGNITWTTAGLLGHNSVGVLCAQHAKEATPLHSSFQQLLSIALMNGSYCCSLTHTGLQNRSTWHTLMYSHRSNVLKIYYLILYTVHTTLLAFSIFHIIIPWMRVTEITLLYHDSHIILWCFKKLKWGI